MSSLFNPFSFFAAVINTATLAMIWDLNPRVLQLSGSGVPATDPRLKIIQRITSGSAPEPVLILYFCTTLSQHRLDGA